MGSAGPGALSSGLTLLQIDVIFFEKCNIFVINCYNLELFSSNNGVLNGCNSCNKRNVRIEVMKLNTMKRIAYIAAVTVTFANVSMVAHAENVSSVLPSAGINYTLDSDATSLSSMQESAQQSAPAKGEASGGINSLTASVKDSIPTDFMSVGSGTQDSGVTTKKIEDTVIVSKGYSADLAKAAGAEEGESQEETFEDLVIAQVNNYVNVRSIPSEEGEILGKLYNNSVGNFIEEQDGWYKISSGSVEGYVKGEFCVTGEDAVELAKQVGTRIATVTTTTLKVRESNSTDSAVLGLVPIEDELIVTEELDGWVKVNIEEGDGYVSTDFVTLTTEFVTAESKAEEEARLAKEKAEREAAQKAAAKKAAQNSATESTADSSAGKTYAPAGSASGRAVVDFAKQFVGNPYVYGGTSLTNGADCSGFVMSVYANFGVSLPHSSAADRNVGAAVPSLAEAQPGDIICYSGHVGIYAGDGMLVHASTSKTGIIISSATYRNILSIRRIF